jgi:hypothetical protein
VIELLTEERIEGIKSGLFAMMASEPNGHSIGGLAEALVCGATDYSGSAHSVTLQLRGGPGLAMCRAWRAYSSRVLDALPPAAVATRR